MYVNKCTKCGSEFETKNPKRVICPNCLYPDKKMVVSPDMSDDGEKQQERQQQQEQQEQSQSSQAEGTVSEGSVGTQQNHYSSYSYDPPQQQQRSYSSDRGSYQRPQQGGYNRDRNYQRPQQGGYNQDRGSYQRPQQGGYNRDRNYQRPQQGGYNQDRGSYQRPQQGGYNQDRNYQRPQQGGYNRDRNYQRPQQGGYNQDRSFQRPGSRPGGSRPPGRFNNNRRPQQRPNKPLLVNREQLEQIELLYRAMLPLPNPDAHEVIGEKIALEPRKVFFGINLIRQKMMLPKLPFPKRKLAISPDQMFAIQNLYEPLLPLPPIGCHKIIAAQLKMDEWRVHVGIGLIRAKMGLERWNQEREDAPEEFKKQKAEEKKKTKKTKEKVEKEGAEKPVKEKKTKKAKSEEAE